MCRRRPERSDTTTPAPNPIPFVIKRPIESTWQGTAQCSKCASRGQGLFAGLTEHDLGLIHAPIDCLVFRAGQSLYSEGELANGIFSIKQGLVKLVRLTGDGRQRIVRVLRSGDLAGMEALASDRYDTGAVAMNELSVCRIPATVIRTLDNRVPKLHKTLQDRWRLALKNADDWLADLNFGSARQRVSHFILKMRSADNQDNVSLFSREDMGAMLDLKLETVSREISALTREGIIEPIDRGGRNYRILQAQKLQLV